MATSGTETTALSHETVARETSRIKRLVGLASDDELLVARGRLADMLESEIDPLDLELVRLRGMLVHAEIIRREASGRTRSAVVARQVWGLRRDDIFFELTALPAAMVEREERRRAKANRDRRDLAASVAVITTILVVLLITLAIAVGAWKR